MVKQNCLISNSNRTSSEAQSQGQPIDQESEDQCISFSLKNKLSLNEMSQEEDNDLEICQQLPELPQRFRLEECNMLGTGSNASVFRGYDLQKKGSIAVKKINTAFFQKISGLEKMQAKKYFSIIENEVQIMKTVQNSVNSNYFVKLEDAYMCQDAPAQYLYMELCEQGTLEQIYQKLNCSQGVFIFQQIVQGVKQLRDQRIIHRDLKLANIYFKNQQVKIGDFGFALQFPENTSEFKSRVLGTALFEAPEILLKKQNFYTLEHDIFSLGVILHLLYYKKFPYLESPEKNDLRERLFNNQRVPVQKKGNYLVENLIDQMLQTDPQDRICWDELMKHPVINFNANIQAQMMDIKILVDNAVPLPPQIQNFWAQQQQNLAQLNNNNNNNNLFRTLNAEEKRLLRGGEVKKVKKVSLKSIQLQNSRQQQMINVEQERMRRVQRESEFNHKFDQFRFGQQQQPKKVQH